MEFLALLLLVCLGFAVYASVQVPAAQDVFTGQQAGAPPIVPVTATSDGLTTGTIPSGPQRQVVKVTSADANHIVVLPAPIPGTEVVIYNGTTGYELRSNSPTTVGINGGTGSGAESAMPASTTAWLFCETTTNWKGYQSSSTAGTLAKVEVAA